MSVEIAVCKLLLGDTSAAEAALGLGPDSPSAPDPDIHSFVKVRHIMLSTWPLASGMTASDSNCRHRHLPCHHFQPCLFHIINGIQLAPVLLAECRGVPLQNFASRCMQGTYATNHAFLCVCWEQSFCDGSEDLLPGLVMMAQQWLSDVLYPSFRGCDNTSLPLQKWFDHPRVSLNLKVGQGNEWSTHEHEQACTCFACIR